MSKFSDPVWTRRKVIQTLAISGLVPAFDLSRGLAHAASPAASDWAEGSHSAMRLIQGSSPSGQSSTYEAGIVLKLASGFKTYWRHPGDSGVPPVFRFEGSENLKEALVHYPMPKSFPDGAGGLSFGYAKPEIILPVTVIAADPKKPVTLKLQADYAVCNTICIPANGLVELRMKQGLQSPFNASLKQAMANVPVLKALGEPGELQVTALRRATAPEHLDIEVRVPGIVQPELFLEGESPWFFEAKAFTPGPQAGMGTFSVAVIERDKSLDCTGADLVLTLVAGKAAIEVRTRLDVALVTP